MEEVRFHAEVVPENRLSGGDVQLVLGRAVSVPSDGREERWSGLGWCKLVWVGVSECGFLLS